MESVNAEATETFMLNPAEPKSLFEKSKELWQRLHELHTGSEKGRLPDGAYLAISEMRDALGREL